ncbi:HNH endonuclease [Armatimonas rosea]|uniref:HNH nuclease domain-containing protein n=1 Tax=Armatimonas rosea TaxID=685828 RepID=A0A7W9SMW8_ARMRO|nr:HNH endonuclease signature motif containing protein [Armatimonas rosea]MBB6049572.1 hypothetical protein [Armatimonas rosea]
MSTTYIPTELRRRVRERAGNCCEYCKIREITTLLGCEVDHIISEKHGGLTIESNLALACFECNRAKGSDLGSYLTAEATQLTRFFHPRWDDWTVHFLYQPTGELVGLTPEGIVTARLFDFNRSIRVAERVALNLRGLYP